MATDFFQRQADAQRSTLWLVILFCLAVVTMVVAVALVAAVIVQIQIQMREPGQSLASHPEQVVIPVIAGAVTALIIIGGSLYRIADLQTGGGTRVAEGLGGQRIYANTQDPVERRLLNVVEEMAIASGTPVPPVFIMEEPGINAFAAGFSTSDAVLGITRGCAEQLTRDELQGVIAHEFSHILNGDMRMSIRLLGILYGILMIGLAGKFILRMLAYSGARSSRSRGKKSGGNIDLYILAVGLTATVVGSLGSFFGNLIKAAVSRQREYLADASAVQFTRNPSGIANALKRIGGSVSGTRLQAANAAEASHMYFAQGVWEGFSGLWATHPSLPKRIRAIEPDWDGKYLKSNLRMSRLRSTGASAFASSADVESRYARQEVPVVVMGHAVDQVGVPTVEHTHYATEVIRSLPAQILENIREPYGARAVIYGLLLDRKQDIRAAQLELLRQLTSADLMKLTLKLQPLLDVLDVRARLPLVDMALPTLRAMSRTQYLEFERCFMGLAKADRRIELFEWMLSQVVLRHLRPQFEPVRRLPINYYGLQRFSGECSALLSTVASAGNTREVAERSFQRGAEKLPELKLTWQPPARDALNSFQPIWSRLNQVAAKHRARLVDACAATICADQHVRWQEAELLRGISDLLDCPMPPLLVPK